MAEEVCERGTLRPDGVLEVAGPAVHLDEDRERRRELGHRGVLERHVHPPLYITDGQPLLGRGDDDGRVAAGPPLDCPERAHRLGGYRPSYDHRVLTVLCGGVGAARLLAGIVAVVDPASVTAVVNVADDLVVHGLHVAPDLDTITYTLGGLNNEATGWGMVDESWRVMDELDALGGATWFRLGDRDLATHLYRTARLADGAPLSLVTTELAVAPSRRHHGAARQRRSCRDGRDHARR